MKSVVLLELNEINFEYIQRYNELGLLPNFKRLIEEHGFSITTSEKEYSNLEPWIQWVTAHTGMTYEEHGVFRLGDIVNFDYEQIWEKLEREKGLKIGAVSPLNTKNRLKNAAFFIPDPWTSTEVTGNLIDKALSKAVSQVVNNNAQNKITLKSKISLVLGLLVYAKIKNYKKYINLALNARRKSWNKPIFLDLLLADVFINKWKSHQPDFSTLFLNAGAHIQHHYMFSSKVYDGKLENPDWYIDRRQDPLLDVFELYDYLIGSIMTEAPNTRFLLATGLTQDPFPTEKFYYRLKNHEKFFRRHSIDFIKIEPRMSRDFLVHCQNDEEAKKAEKNILSIKSSDNIAMFSVDNRGSDLFVMLVYPKEIAKNFGIYVNNKFYKKFYEDVSFVAIKNGEHNGKGFFLDTNEQQGRGCTSFPLTNMPQIIENHFG